jgi:hypothetical protein
MADGKDERVCKFCYSHTNPLNMKDDLISPCNCKGSIGYVHGVCLKMWRYQSKNIKDIRKCEQCASYYRIENEIVPHRIIVSSLSVLVMMLVYYICTVMFKSLIDVFVLVLKDFLMTDLELLAELGPGSELENMFSREGIFYKCLRFAPNHHYYTFIALFIYQLMNKPNLFAIFNYVFTFWRLVQFNFSIDKVLFGFMSTYYIKKIYDAVYGRVDAALIFVLNYK